MHSSRMRTAHLLPISPSIHCSGGYLPRGGVPAQGCTCQGVYLPGLVYLPGGGVYLPGRCTWWGVYLPEGCTCPGGVSAWGYLPWYSPVNRITDWCKNITLPQTSFAAGKNVKNKIICDSN